MKRAEIIDAIYTPTEAEKVASSLIGVEYGYKRETLRKFVCDVLTSVSRLNTGIGGHGAGKTIGACILAEQLKKDGFEVVVMIPQINRRMVTAELYEKAGVTVLNYDSFFEYLANAENFDRHYWIFDEYKSLSETEKRTVLKAVKAFNPRILVLGTSDNHESNMTGEVFVGTL
jgi:thymidine kinase